jgi:cytochrome b561
MTIEDYAPAATHRYARVAILLHWAIALFILFNLGLGYFMEGFPPPLKMVILPLHISSGITVLALTVIRVVWRLIHSPPRHDPPLPRAEHDASHIVHFLLYVGMVLMPLSGWAILSSHPTPGSPGAAVEAASRPAPPPGAKAPPAGGRGIRVWYVVPLPSIRPIQTVGDTPGGLAPQKKLHEQFVSWHGLGGYIMIALLLLHVAGALKHQWLDHEPELQRMGLGRKRRLADAPSTGPSEVNGGDMDGPETRPLML